MPNHEQPEEARTLADGSRWARFGERWWLIAWPDALCGRLLGPVEWTELRRREAELRQRRHPGDAA